MKVTRSAEEILKKHCINHVWGQDYHSVLRAMEEYHAQFSPVVTDEEIKMYFPSEVGQSVIMERDMSYDQARQANYYRRQGAKAMRDGKIVPPEITTRDLKEIDEAREERMGAPFDEPIYNPDTLPESHPACKKCGYQNTENCHTCDIINPHFR
jgi:hypothetical protein